MGVMIAPVDGSGSCPAWMQTVEKRADAGSFMRVGPRGSLLSCGRRFATYRETPAGTLDAENHRRVARSRGSPRNLVEPDAGRPVVPAVRRPGPHPVRLAALLAVAGVPRPSAQGRDDRTRGRR